MTVEVRPVVGDEFDELVRVDHAAFGEGPPDGDHVGDLRRAAELDRTRAVFEDGRMVGASAALSLELTVPGPATVPAAGVTLVGVLPTHRRRGHLRRMMGALLDDAAARGEPLAALLASESLIYGRFGYGVATSEVSVEIDTDHGSFLPRVPSGGRVTLVDPAEAAKVLPEVLDAARRRTPGDVTRPASWWDGVFRDPERRRDGAGARFYAVHESPRGEADGYAVYRVKSEWDAGLPRGRALAGEVVGLTPEAEADLWRYLLSLDLVEVVQAGSRPFDDPLRWMLADPRRLRVTARGDFLWVRVLDVSAALSARRYATDGRLVLEVADGFRPATSGTYTLEGGPEGAACRRSHDEPDLALAVEDLGALYLGDVGASVLAAAGRVVERRPGALTRADAMLAVHPAPFCRTHF